MGVYADPPCPADTLAGDQSASNGHRMTRELVPAFGVVRPRINALNIDPLCRCAQAVITPRRASRLEAETDDVSCSRRSGDRANVLPRLWRWRQTAICTALACVG